MRQFSYDLCGIGRYIKKKEKIVNVCFKFHISIVLLKDVAKVYAKIVFKTRLVKKRLTGI